MAIKNLEVITHHLFICNGGTCKQKGAEEGTAAIRAAIQSAGLHESVHTTKTLCNGRCKDGPIVISATDGFWFKGVTPALASGLVEEYLVKGVVPEEHLLYVYGSEKVQSEV